MIDPDVQHRRTGGTGRSGSSRLRAGPSTLSTSEYAGRVLLLVLGDGRVERLPACRPGRRSGSCPCPRPAGTHRAVLQERGARHRPGRCFHFLLHRPLDDRHRPPNFRSTASNSCGPPRCSAPAWTCSPGSCRSSLGQLLADLLSASAKRSGASFMTTSPCDSHLPLGSSIGIRPGTTGGAPGRGRPRGVARVAALSRRNVALSPCACRLATVAWSAARPSRSSSSLKEYRYEPGRFGRPEQVEHLRVVDAEDAELVRLRPAWPNTFSSHSDRRSRSCP